MRLSPVSFIRGLLGDRECHACKVCPMGAAMRDRKILLFGSPNVGKSVIFGELTGSYAVVSNYPGTTVEVSRGRARMGDLTLDVADSPGTYSLAALSEDEEVARDLLFDEPFGLVLHCVDARQLQRMLPLTLQLIETGLPLALDVNVIDEAERAGLTVDVGVLSRELGIPVAATAASSGVGVEGLKGLVSGSLPAASGFAVEYPARIESAISRIEELLKGDYRLSRRAIALLLLQHDRGARARVASCEPEALIEADRVVAEAQAAFPQPLAFSIAVARRKATDRVAARALRRDARPVRPSAAEVAGHLAMHPVSGIVILAIVLYSMYLVVGKLGAGVAVDFLEGHVFGAYVNPAVTALVERLLPWPVASSLFVGEYGVLTLGVRYAVAIVLPLVAAFFAVFALLEDSGYLPRLALLVDRAFKRMGLSGRAVIPLVLGLGCDTMATIVTRVLETRRERIIATFLLALAIPCSAQLGVILGVLSRHPVGLAIWGGVVVGVFVLSGVLAARVLPGEASRFYLEVPPMRVPSARNVARKTFARLKWYAAEVIPIFLFASVLIWLGQLTHLFQLGIAALRPVVGLIGLPATAADAFLFGFFRRDYGAARLFDVSSQGALSGLPLVVAMVTLTLFIPCVAQFLVMQKERGARVAFAVAAIILPFSFGVGYALNFVLTGLQVRI